MNKLDQHVDFDGKPIAEESYNEINKMLYRIKDFETVYNISESKFKQKEEEINIKKSIDEIVDITKTEMQKKHLFLTINHGDIPNTVKVDSNKFKQVVLNLLL